MNEETRKKWEERGKKMQQTGESMQKGGNTMAGCGCLMTLFITIPILLLFFF